IDGDNQRDIATANAFDGTVSILKNMSSGGWLIFAYKIDYNTGNNPRNIVLGDVNGDARPDIITATYVDNTISVLKNNVGFSEGEICPGATALFIAKLTGPNYQWQQDSGAGFINIADNNIFLGTQ